MLERALGILGTTLLVGGLIVALAITVNQCIAIIHDDDDDDPPVRMV